MYYVSPANNLALIALLVITIKKALFRESGTMGMPRASRNYI